MIKDVLSRRLAVIVAADVVGFSRLMEADEGGTLAQLKSIRKELIDPKIAEHRGRLVKTTGDGLLMEFSSVTDGVQATIEIQEALAERNTAVPTDRRLLFRMGINLGEIITEGEDIYGTGVNVAARLESLAEPGGICVSASVHEQIQSLQGLGFEDLGEQLVKNLSRPVRSFALRTMASDPIAYQRVSRFYSRESDGDGGSHRRVPSIAVLPFTNLSGDSEQEYFADGIAEDIITALSKISNLLVLSRNSTFAYKGKAVDVHTIGRELNVRYVLEGSVRKAGDRVRITAQLVEAVGSATSPRTTTARRACCSAKRSTSTRTMPWASCGSPGPIGPMRGFTGRTQPTMRSPTPMSSRAVRAPSTTICRRATLCLAPSI